MTPTEPTTFPEPEEAPIVRPRRKGWLGRHLRGWSMVIALALAGLVGAAFLVYGYGAANYRWRGMDVQVRLVPSLHGETRLIFAPLGEVRAPTHRTPVALAITLREVSFEEVKSFLRHPPDRDALEKDFQQTARAALMNFAARQIALGVAGGLLIPLLLRLKRSRFYLVSGMSGGVFVAVLFFHAAGTFNPRAFASPTYTGSLQEANWIIGVVKEGFVKAGVLSDRLKGVADNLNTLYGRLEAIPGVSRNRDAIKVLHISDIHNNPAAASFVRELAEKNGVDLIIDTGDLTDLGLPVEADLTKNLRDLKVPYLFVAGNHDSQATVNALRQNPNVVIVHDSLVLVDGLSVIGAPDPSSARPGPGSVDTPDGTLKAASDLLLAAFQKTPADIVCVHNPKQAASLIGKAKLVLCGHLHTASLENRQGTIVCNAGTTGAAGVRYFESRDGVPFTASVLYLSKTPDHRLLYVDQFALDGNFGGYSIARKSFEPIDEPGKSAGTGP